MKWKELMTLKFDMCGYTFDYDHAHHLRHFFHEVNAGKGLIKLGFNSCDGRSILPLHPCASL